MLDFTFITKVIPKDTQKSDESVKLKIHLTDERLEGCPRYLLQCGKKVLGDIYLVNKKEYVYITLMHSLDKNNYKYIGKALHEFAIRYSFSKGLEGKVKLCAAWRSDGFHFKSGYRYDNHQLIPHGMNFQDEKINHLCLKYFKKNDDKKNTDKILNKISLEPLYEDLIKSATIELNRPPVNSQEAVEFGYCWDKNLILDRVYYHPEEKRKVSIYSKTIFDFEGPMSLSVKTREEWRKIIEQEKGNLDP